MLDSGVPRARFCLLALAIVMMGAALLGLTSSRASAGGAINASPAGHDAISSDADFLVKAGRPVKERPPKGEDPTTGEDPAQAKEEAKQERRCASAEEGVKEAQKQVKKKKKKKKKAPRGKKKKRAKRQLKAAKSSLGVAEARAEKVCQA
jgi:hypothetical protein